MPTNSSDVPGSTVEKITLALWVFAGSGTIHALVTWKTESEADAVSHLQFLLPNFLGGLAEMAMRRTNLVGGGRQSFPILYKAAVKRMSIKMKMNVGKRA
ncbi:hypothetical protein VCV18_002829 [Metarhizium anisopliae]